MNPSYPGKILLIDDDQDTLDIYNEFLIEAGYKVEVAKDGKEGLDKILQGGYDLILLDIMMPKLDGMGVLKALKQNPPTVYNGPIIILSALDQDYIIKTAMELGAKGFLPKANVDPQKALEKITEFLKNPENPPLA